MVGKSQVEGNERMKKEIQKIAVIGAGTMGHGIAQIGGMAGYEVALHDSDRARVDQGLSSIASNLRKGVDRGKVSEETQALALGCIRGATEFLDAVAEADLIIEAIPENMELKQSLFQDIARMAPDEAILASNTSSLSVTEIASAVPNPGRFIGTHFFNPPHIVTLLELVMAYQTNEDTLQAVREAGERMGRHIIVVKDSPGFASSRLGLILGLEAMRMLESGVASVEDIDSAMVQGYRHPMGPLRLTDLVGLDVRLAIAEHLWKEVGEQFRPPNILRKMVRAGKLGKKSGEGFYSWD